FNEAFLHHVDTGRPLVTLKMAQTLDARVAGISGESRWISGEASRRLVHHWRATTDGVLVGTETALRDDPALTVRHVEGRHPTRIVLDRSGRLPGHLQLFNDEQADHTVVITAVDTTLPYAEDLASRGGRVIGVQDRNGQLNLKDVLSALGKDAGPDGRSLQSLLVEGGSTLGASLLREDLVDRLYLFIAPLLLGAGTLSVNNIGREEIDHAYTFVEKQWDHVGDDVLFKGFRRKL
ncbi:MAG: RibD family protein, partial [Rhodothermales bacterium]